LLVAALVLLPALYSHKEAVFHEASATTEEQAVSVWSTVTLEEAAAYSKKDARPINACIRPTIAPAEVYCFSIQQNFWIYNSRGDMIFWAQNVVELAKIQGATYFATYAFLVWNSTNVNEPVICDPASSTIDVCRTPYYTNPIRFPQSFTFYDYISNEDSRYILHMTNNYGSDSWDIPASAACPCFIGTIRQGAPPWGYFPFEMTLVGLDNSATAIFGEGTSGNFGPAFVQTLNGVWHEGSLNTLRCPPARTPYDCPMPLATAENSQNLRWDNTTSRFYWSDDGNDQGVYISAVSAEASLAPLLPQPSTETFLYTRMYWGTGGGVAVLTLFDEGGKATGYEPKSGKFVEDIPGSFIDLTDEEEVVILDPSGSYHLLITAVGSGSYHFFLTRATNTGGVELTKRVNGTINQGESKEFSLDVRTMNISSFQNVPGSLPVLMVGVGLVGVILGVVYAWRRSRHASFKSI
jgi:hypothetical protein